MLDLETNKVSVYCLPEPTMPIDGSLPIWSPDSNYVAVTQILDDNNRRVVVLSIQDGWMAKVAENESLIGWMLSASSHIATPTP